MLDLQFGPRLLAMPITEEVGETVDDWHWNRYDHTALLTVESQASLMRLEPTMVVEEVWPLIERQQDLPEEERRRLSLACQWYWRADAEPDRVTRYIDWWVIVECLEMPDTTNIRQFGAGSQPCSTLTRGGGATLVGSTSVATP